MKKLDLKALYQKEINNHIQFTTLLLEKNFIEFKKFFEVCFNSLKNKNKIIFLEMEEVLLMHNI